MRAGQPVIGADKPLRALQLKDIAYPDSGPTHHMTLETIRWIAYFDLLGTRRLVEKGEVFTVYEAYHQATCELESKSNSRASIDAIWFSDTFVILGQDHSTETFSDVEQTSRHFLFRLLTKYAPARGAIALGGVYFDKEKQHIIGSGLLEAHDYGEAQDWIGMVFTPSASTALSERGVLPNLQRYYREWDVPIKANAAIAREPLHAHILGAIDRTPMARKALGRLREEAPPSCSAKYDRSLDFLRTAGLR